MPTPVLQLAIIFVFGLVISGIVALGIVRAREVTERTMAVRRHEANEPT
jgi:hypothetical protein